MIEVWKGLFKVQEEMGELAQLLGKLGPFPRGKHPDGKSNRRSLIEEIGDLEATLTYFKEQNFSEAEIRDIAARSEIKLKKFKEWGLTGLFIQESKR